jgi:hypothetical protein
MSLQAFYDYATSEANTTNEVGKRVKCSAEALSEELKNLNIEDTFQIEEQIVRFVQELQELRSAQNKAAAAEEAAYR